MKILTTSGDFYNSQNWAVSQQSCYCSSYCIDDKREMQEFNLTYVEEELEISS